MSVSVMAAVTVVLIMLAQRILHKRIKPRWQYLMWLLVIVRLLLPWDLESNLSIYNWLTYPGTIHELDPAAQLGTQSEHVVIESAKGFFYRYSMYIWLLGTAIFGIYTIVINRRFSLKLTNETRPMTDIGVLTLFSQCQKVMSVHKPVALVVSDKLSTPTLFGFKRPRLVMPQTVLNSLSQEQLRHVFLHELAHCKRNDIGINWIMQFLLIIHWFNPVLWYAHQRMREDQEIASDALALTYLDPDKREDYGYTLIQLLESCARPVSVPGNVNLSGSKAQLKRRIIMIKQFQFNSYRWSFVGLAAVLIISGCSLTNAKVDQKSAESTSSVVDQKTVDQKTTDTSTPKPETGKTTESGTVVETKPGETTAPTPSEEPKPTSTSPVVKETSPQTAAPSTPELRPAPTAAPAGQRVEESRSATAEQRRAEESRRAAAAVQPVSEPRQAPVVKPAEESRPAPVAQVVSQ
nr:M56 family metallopeptidase [Paenibacillus aceris]